MINNFNSDLDKEEEELYNQIKSYNESQNKIRQIIKNNNSTEIELYLINDQWLKQWKKYTCYKQIKYNLSSNIKNKWKEIRHMKNASKFNIAQINIKDFIKFDNSSINPNSNFHLVTKECFDIITKYKNNNNEIFKIKFISYNEKIIAQYKDLILVLYINNNNFNFILFILENPNIPFIYMEIKESNMKQYLENNSIDENVENKKIHFEKNGNNYSIDFINKSYNIIINKRRKFKRLIYSLINFEHNLKTLLELNKEENNNFFLINKDWLIQFKSKLNYSNILNQDKIENLDNIINKMFNNYKINDLNLLDIKTINQNNIIFNYLKEKNSDIVYKFFANYTLIYKDIWYKLIKFFNWDLEIKINAFFLKNNKIILKYDENNFEIAEILNYSINQKLLVCIYKNYNNSSIIKEIIDNGIDAFYQKYNINILIKNQSSQDLIDYSNNNLKLGKIINIGAAKDNLNEFTFLSYEELNKNNIDKLKLGLNKLINKINNDNQIINKIINIQNNNGNKKQSEVIKDNNDEKEKSDTFKMLKQAFNNNETISPNEQNNIDKLDNLNNNRLYNEININPKNNNFLNNNFIENNININAVNIQNQNIDNKNMNKFINYNNNNNQNNIINKVGININNFKINDNMNNKDNMNNEFNFNINNNINNNLNNNINFNMNNVINNSLYNNINYNMDNNINNNINNNNNYNFNNSVNNKNMNNNTNYNMINFMNNHMNNINNFNINNYANNVSGGLNNDNNNMNNVSGSMNNENNNMYRMNYNMNMEENMNYNNNMNAIINNKVNNNQMILNNNFNNNKLILNENNNMNQIKNNNFNENNMNINNMNKVNYNNIINTNNIGYNIMNINNLNLMKKNNNYIINSNVDNNNLNLNNMNAINNMNLSNMNNQNNMFIFNNNQNNFYQNFNNNNMNNNMANQLFMQNIYIESILSVILCLYNCDNITQKFLYHSKYNEIIKKNTLIAPIYAKIIYSFQNGISNHKQYLYRLKDIMDKNINLISYDPKNIFEFIIEGLHKELKVPYKKKNFNLVNLGLRKLQYDYFLNNTFYPEKTSVIANNLFGGREINIHCKSCQTINYEYDIFKFIEFSIEEIYYKKNEKNINFIIKQENELEEKKININDCFDYYINFQQIKNNYFCFNCQNNRESFFYYRLIKLPNILILVLNRKTKIKIKVDFDEDLDISKFLEFNVQSKQYKLIGIISFLEENNTYLTILKNKNDRQWYKYKDDYISKVRFIDSKDNINNIPYMLFYQNILE